MAMTYRRGSRGSNVEILQNALNTKLTPSPNLTPDGIFGSRTDSAVRTYQRGAWLAVDGIIGPCTFNALMDLETYTPIQHRNISLIAQPTNSTCWAAATAMLKRTTVNAIIAATPAALVSGSGGTPNFSERADHVTGNQQFARAHNLRYQAPQSHSVAGFRNLVTRSPVMLSMLWTPRTFAAGAGSSGHRVVVVGMRGDGDQSGKATTLMIFDPWRPNVGSRRAVTYYKIANDTPLFTYGVFTR